ncbi:MAG: redoxin domain-containing protein, partial [Ginsengibacter sp.]
MSKKNFLRLLLSFGFLLFMSRNSFAQLQVLSKGATAPVFTAKASQAGNEFNFALKKALAKGPVVLYFYPAAYTGGCDLEAHTFAEDKDKFKDAGATVIGVSADDIQR